MNKQKDEMGDSVGYFKKKKSERETCSMRLLTGRKDRWLVKTEPSQGMTVGKTKMNIAFAADTLYTPGK